MKEGKFIIAVSGFIFLLLLGCNGGGGSSDATSDQAVPPYEASFVISKLEIGDINQGFNLDNENTQCTSGQCIPDGANGVDNRLSAILEAINGATSEDFNANESIAKSINEGDMLIILRITDINLAQMASPTGSDLHVEVKGYMGVDTDNPADPSDNLSGEEPLDVDSRSLSNPANIESALIHFTDCNINAGKLRCQPSLFKLELQIQDRVLNLDIEQTQMVATINQSPQQEGGSGPYLHGSLKQGIIGGYVPIKNLQEALDEFASELEGINPQTIQNILVEHADIDAIPAGPTDVQCPNGDKDCMPWQLCQENYCVEPPHQMDAISLAVVFEAVSTEFTGHIVTPQ